MTSDRARAWAERVADVLHDQLVQDRYAAHPTPSPVTRITAAILPLAEAALDGEALARAVEADHEGYAHADDPQFLAHPDDPPLALDECPLDGCKVAARILRRRAEREGGDAR